ncbi:MAG: carbohydrate ABC transporter substrate-binding protein, partial [Egibacteraceae bacterium]
MTEQCGARSMPRRVFLRTTGMAALAAACGRGGGPDLRILMWSHFVPQHDRWFDQFATQWGRQVGVNVTVDHIDNAAIPTRISSEISAGQGHDLIQYIAPLPQFEQSVL